MSEVSADDTWPSRPYHVRIEVRGESDAVAKLTRQLILDGLGAACVEREPADKCFRINFVGERQPIVRVVEEDLWLHDVSDPAFEPITDQTLGAATAARLARTVFRPRLKITRIDDDYLASVWGGRLDNELLSTADCFAAYLRFHDRDNRWRQTQPIAWTYLFFPSQAAFGQPIEVVSAYPQPLPGRLRRGTVVALRTPSIAATTKVSFVDRDTGRPRQGIRVEIVPAVASGDHSEPGPMSLRTDRFGMVALSKGDLQDAGFAGISSVVRLRVFSTEILADVPVNVGAKRDVTIQLAPDRERVDFDERVAVIENELQDLVAQRAVLVAKIKADIEAERWSTAEESLSKLNDLPDSSGLIVLLNAARVAAVTSATDRGDRTLAARIRRRATRLETTLTQYANPDIDDDFRDEIAALREIQEAAEATRLPKTERIQQD